MWHPKVTFMADRPESRTNMESGNQDSKDHGRLVELMRVQPFEAEVIAARLRAWGIAAAVGADSVYPSVTFADGVPVFVSEDDVPRALALLEDNEVSE
jgi:hypothetical protein